MRTSSLNLARRAMATATQGRVPLLLTPRQYQDLPQSSTVPLDVSWHMPNANRSAFAEYLSGPRLPGARRFDQDEVAELNPSENPLSLGHMLPSAKLFAKACAELGITRDTHLVVYDSVGVFSSPRAVYTFRALGHEKVSLLDGGLPRWIAEGYEVEVGDTANFGHAEYAQGSEVKAEDVRTYEQVVRNAKKDFSDPSAEIVLDHRSRARWEGTAPEPRPGLSSGHIPHSLSCPFVDYLDPPSDTKPYTSYKPLPELQDVLVNAVGGEDRWKELAEGKRNLVFSCGSGMTAAVGWLANEVIRETGGKAAKAAIYDESWTGYASRPESEIVKGGGSS